MSSRFVKPQIVRLPISNGDWIDVKRRLNTGEQHDVYERMAPQITAGERPQMQSKAVMTARVLGYLVAWSLTDEGAPVPMTLEMSEKERLDTINSLDPDTFAEIREAIEAHETAVEKAITDSKNVPAGESASSPISPSLNSVTGSMSGSMSSTLMSTTS